MGITFFSSSQIGITENHRKILILNLNNFFSRQLKKILNGQKFGNSFIFKLPKVGGSRLKTVIHFFRFSESTIKMTKRCPIEYQIAINSNIYLSKQSRSVISPPLVMIWL